ncbi:MAG: hypothetical protein HY911_07780 [Desulfobacterales bacterium]|nr:hypothetical protein [Desulfobacterales bacterium]
MVLGKNSFRTYVLCTLLFIFAHFSGKQAFAQGAAPAAPPPDPPRVVRHSADAEPSAQRRLQAAPTSEWTLHKTADNRHPDGNEQQMLWLMNRARSAPAQEGLWLATATDDGVASGRDYFGVDVQQLQAEFDQYAAKPPAAFDARLYAAAQAHSLDLIARDAQDHTGQFEAIADAGFFYTAARGNVFAYADSALNAHAAFNIDWGGSDDSGMQAGRGHRMAVMAIDGDYTNVGLAAAANANGNLVVTGNYCRANTQNADHHNRFLVGTVWADANANDLYDPGEGLGQITVRPDEGTFYAVTADNGGYALPILSPGTYAVTFSGAALDADVTRSVTLANVSVLLDLLASDPSPPPDDGPTPPPDNGGSDTGGGGGGGCFIGALSSIVALLD